MQGPAAETTPPSRSGRRMLTGCGIVLFLGMALVLSMEIVALRAARQAPRGPTPAPPPGSPEAAESPRAVAGLASGSIPAVEALSLEQKIGQLLIIGIPAQWTADTDETVSVLQPGGVVLLRRNIRSRSQVQGLTAELRACLAEVGAPPPLMVVAHEGRADDYLHAIGLASFGANAELGGKKDVVAVRNQAEIMASELRSLGITMTLAPVLDVAMSGQPYLGDRVYSSDAAVCGELGAAFIETLQQNGVIACAKHWPGIDGVVGRSDTTSRPLVRISAEEWRNRVRPSFAAALQAGLRCVMTANADYPDFGSGTSPAGLSSFIVGGLLRTELGFDGVVISHPLDADPGTIPPPEAASRALSAGVDMVMVWNDFNAQRYLFDRLLEAVRAGRLPESRIDESVRRILDLKRFQAELATSGPSEGEESAE